MHMPDAGDHATHEVTNQPGDLADYNAYGADIALQQAVAAFDAAWAGPLLTETGAVVGSARVQDLARSANRFLPELVTHDRFGHRVDRIELHPAWHELMGLCFASKAHSLAWEERRPGAQVARAALSFLWNQAENGICCPMGMTFASVAALRHDEDLAAYWEPLLLRPTYDPRPLPAEQKTGLTAGMAMTEKQGGSDLRATQTWARPTDKARRRWLLTGHKWFFSVPQSDVFLTLARGERGISCFLARGWLEGGARNRLQLQRLKDKCGNRSNASSEVEFRDLEADLVGEEGRGIRTLIEMAHLTRLDFAIGSAGLMRQAVAQALHHTSHRRAFQKRLIDQAIMTKVVADLVMESEAMLWLGLRLAATLDREREAEEERLLGRIATPVAKYWACKQAPGVVAEALECHGGNGFIETHLMARLYREAPLNGIWEGSGNVICLDVVRALQREPDCAAAFLNELRLARGASPLLDREIGALADVLPDLARNEGIARWVVERMAVALQASLLFRHAPSPLAEAFAQSRLGYRRSGHFGALPDGLPLRQLIERAAPPGGA